MLDRRLSLERSRLVIGHFVTGLTATSYLLLLVPLMMLDQCDDKVDWNKADNPTRHVDDWDGTEAHGADFLEWINLADTLNDFDVLWAPLQHILHSDVLIHFRHVIPQEGHLLHSDGIVVQASIAGFGNTHRNTDCEQCRQEIVNTLGSLQHDHCQRICQTTITCQHGRSTNDDVRLATDLLNLRIETIH